MLPPALRHELSFWHGCGRLAGDLVLPPRRGPHPVVLAVNDPSVTERDHSSWLCGMAEAGYACFTWDRGTAESSSRDPVRRVADQAREVLAALDRVSCLAEIDADAVALIGWGEGGWAAAQAATFSSRVRALVLAGTPTATPAALVEHRLIQRLRAAGHAGSDVATARDVVRRRIETLLAGRDLAGDTDLAVLTAEHSGEPWYGVLRSVDEFARPEMEDLPADPLPTLSAVGVPVLALFGEQDVTLPLEQSVRGVRTALREAGHDDHRVAVVRGADRMLRVRPGHGLGSMIDGRHQFGEWPPGLTAVLVDWLDLRIRTHGELPALAPSRAPELSQAPVGVPEGSRASRASRTSGGSAAWRPTRPLLPVRQVRRRISR